MGQPRHFDLDERYRRLSETGDLLVKLATLIDFEAFQLKLTSTRNGETDRRVAAHPTIQS